MKAILSSLNFYFIWIELKGHKNLPKFDELHQPLNIHLPNNVLSPWVHPHTLFDCSAVSRTGPDGRLLFFCTTMMFDEYSKA